MSLNIKSIAAAGLFAASALAHGTVMSFAVDGKHEGGYLLQYHYDKQNKVPFPEVAGWTAENLDNGFVEPNSYAKPDIICHLGATPAPISASVAAGGKVDFFWSVWPDSHVGPVLTYVAKCDGDCADADKTALEWVKIDEAGYSADTKTWAAEDLIANNNTWTTTVPASLEAGNYVFRHEIIALHGGAAINGAQNYPQCINIAVTGSGTDSPKGVLGTELYTPTDAGINFNPYAAKIDYPIPGPKLWTGGASSGSPAPAPAPETPVTPAPGNGTVPVTEPTTPESPVTPEEPTTPEPTTPEPTTPEPTTPETPVDEECPTKARRRARRAARAARRHARNFQY